MNGWLGLIHQGLAPWKKRQASLGAPTDWLTGASGWRDYFSIIAQFWQSAAVANSAAAASFISQPNDYQVS
jgi:hypothetical protein